MSRRILLITIPAFAVLLLVLWYTASFLTDQKHQDNHQDNHVHMDEPADHADADQPAHTHGGEDRGDHPREEEAHRDIDQTGAADTHDDDADGEAHGSEQGIHLTDEAKEGIGISTVVVEERVIEQPFVVNGMIRPLPDKITLVSSRVQGKVTRVYANLGDDVRTGQKLVDLRSLDLERLESDLRQAHASLQRAKADLARVRQLVELKIGSKRDLLDKELQVVNLQREMNGLENQLRIIGLTDAQVNQVMQGKRYDSLLTLRASIDGLVIERNATLGEIVAPDKPLFTIADLRRVIAEGDAFEPSLSFLQKGLAARVTVPAYPRQVFQGKITFVSFQVDPVKRTIHFWAEVPNTKDYRLRPNMFARISVIARSATKALAVPLNALLREGGQDFVFVDRDDRFLRTPVRLGARDDRMVEIKDGLFPGDRVVTDGKRQLYTLSRMGTSGGEALGGHGH